MRTARSWRVMLRRSVTADPVRAALLTTLPTRHLPVRVVPDPRPGPGELLVAVSTCGICGTDLHILEGDSYRPELPFVLGHEPVGRVVAAGDEVDQGWIGQRVTMTLFRGEGACARCLAGDERLCADLISITGVMGAWGGFAELLVVGASRVLPVPDSVEDATAASLVDAGATAANSVRNAPVPHGALTVIVGGGPVGHFEAELLRDAQRRYVVVQPSEARRDALTRNGHPVVALAQEIEEAPAAVIDAAGAPGILPWALAALTPQGVYVAAGYGLVDGLDLAPAARKELVIRGVRSGRRDDLALMMELVAAGRVRVPPISVWPLGSIDDALHALRAREVPGKAVIDVRS
ncbi:MAG: alcohol dehydrogenase catalytic domain-containing protein [Chloroflexi bacterium]|nr:alcohol dehydrogenase catalytic domain-containing protein [Chloroflexota bacterium]